MTVEQADKVERWARSLANGKVLLLFDADGAGDNGAKEALWLLAQRGLQVRLGWTRSMHSGKFDGWQPESVSTSDWQAVIQGFRLENQDW